MNIPLRATSKWLILVFGLFWSFTGWAQQAENADYEYVQVIENTPYHHAIPNGLATAIRNPQHGTLSFNSNPKEIVYTPDAGFTGTDSLVVEIYNSFPLYIEYVALELHVKPSIVKAENDYVAGPAGAVFANINVLDNDSTTIGGLKVKRIALLNDGAASLSSDSTKINFTPEAGFTGVAGVIYTVCDPAGSCDQGMLLIRVKENPVVNDTFNIPMGEAEMLPVILPDLNYSLNQGPSNGTISNHTNLVFHYEPDNNFHGLDSFSFTGPGGAEAVYYIDVVNKPTPNRFAKEDVAYISTQMDSVNIDITANDFRQWNIKYKNLSLTQQPQFGTATLDNNTGLVTYHPNPGFEGIDEFEYELFFPIPWTKEKAKIYVVVSDQEPISYTFDLTTPMNTPHVIHYGATLPEFEFNIDLEPSNGMLYYYPGDTTIMLQGQEVSGRNMVVYEPLEDYVSGSAPDEFELSYCVGNNNCVSVKVDMNVEDFGAAPYCIGHDCLWAGDANTDGLVDMRDVLTIGLGMGEKGTARSGASNQWYGQEAPNWEYNGIDLPLAHADSDGDGYITELDADAVLQNYQKTNDLVPQIASVAKQNISLQLVTPPPYEAGDLLEVDILYGTAANPVIDGYGFSFSFLYNSEVITDSTVQVSYEQDSWLGYTSPLLTAEKQPAYGRMDFAVSRTNGLSTTGHGKVARLSFIIEEDLQGIRPDEEFNLQISVAGLSGMNGWGQFSNLPGATLNIPISMLEEEPQTPTTQDVVAFPNPAPDEVMLYLNGSGQIQEVTLFSLTGQQLLQIEDIQQTQVRLDVSGLQAGVYIARLHTTFGPVSKKIQVIRP